MFWNQEQGHAEQGTSAPRKLQEVLRFLSSQEVLLAASLPYATWIPLSVAALLDAQTGMSRKGPGSQSS